jgi:hypothetical protein
MGGEIMKRYTILGIIVGAVTEIAVLQAQAQVPRNPPLIIGTVNPDGISQTPTNAFTIAHPNDGHYVITFTAGVFNTPQACIVMPIGAVFVNDLDESFNVCDFTMVSLDGSPANTFFNFMAAPITLTLQPSLLSSSPGTGSRPSR